jgi:hypothetical protein
LGDAVPVRHRLGIIVPGQELARLLELREVVVVVRHGEQQRTCIRERLPGARMVAAAA